MVTPFLSDPGQKFACRECPARCCRMPWRITVTEAEHDRLLALAWIPERLQQTGTSFEKLPSGQFSVPTRSHDRLLQCSFLDDDGLCSIHKREGLAATPQTCQTFPFGFIEHADGSWQTYLSHLCPSIRDNYGEDLAPMLPAVKERMRGLAPFKLVHDLRLGLGRISQPDYLTWADLGSRLLQSGIPPQQALLQLHQWTGHLAAGVSPGKTHAGPLRLHDVPPASLLPPRSPTQWAVSTRLLLATCLLPASYPARIGNLYRGVQRAQVYLGALQFVQSLVTQKGQADLLFLPRPVDLPRALEIASALSDSNSQDRLGRFLGGLLTRRNFFFTDKSLEEIVFLMALAGSLVCFFARLKAASEDRTCCTERDLADGESLAELLLTYHGNMIHSHQALRLLVGFMSTYPPSFQGLLETY